MSKRKKRNKPTRHKQNNTLNTFSVGPNLQIHDAPYHKDSPDKGGKEQNPMKNPLQFIGRWWNHLGDTQNSNRVVAVFTIVIALTGILYARYAAKQWDVMQKSFI